MYFSTISGALICGLMLIFCVSVSSNDNFNPRADAEILKQALIEFSNINKKDVIGVLAHRSHKQRIEIGKQFYKMYRRDLVARFKMVTSGDFQKLLVAMMTPLEEYYSDLMYNATIRIFPKNDVLIQTMCFLSNQEIKEIKKAFEKKFQVSLEKHFGNRLYGDFEDLMISLSKASRDETTEVDVSAAWEEAYQLQVAGIEHFGTNETLFIAMLTEKSIEQLKLIFKLYFEKFSKNTIERDIDKEFSFAIKKGLLAIVKNVTNRAEFFAEKIYEAIVPFDAAFYEIMKKIEKFLYPVTVEDLISLIVPHSKAEMEQIKQSFNNKFNHTLESFIHNHTYEDFRDCLLALIS